jgi:hypothetical protein
MKRLIAVLLSLSLGILTVFTGQAQPDLQPIYIENTIDRVLIGLEGGYGFSTGFGTLKPFGGLAYGLDSQKIRHKIGLELSSVTPSQMTNTFGISHVDWPSGAVLGREGEMGFKLSASRNTPQLFDFTWLRIHTKNNLFVGTLWDKRADAPEVAYFHVNQSLYITLPYRISLEWNSISLNGSMMLSKAGQGDLQGTLINLLANGLFASLLPSDKKDESKIFNSSLERISLRVGQLGLYLSSGKLSNRANLEGFAFSHEVIGYADVVKNEQFWKFSVDRRFPLLWIPLNLPRPPYWPADAPWFDEELPVHGVLLFEGLNSTPKAAADQDPETKNFFGWGLGLELTVFEGLTIDAKIIFNSEGKITFGGMVGDLF